MSPFWRALVILLMSVLAAGFLLVGMLTDYIGFNAMFIACGSVTMLVCVAALMHPKVRGLN